jgi:hypothetical protein
MISRLDWLVDPDTESVVSELRSYSPRDAAMKAATRHEKRICLVEVATGKLHVFRGERVPLAPQEENSFTRRMNLTSKPCVSKLAYRNTGQPMTRHTVSLACESFRELLQ